MQIFDAHCDVLMKMFIDPNLFFDNNDELQINYHALNQTGGKLQCFAIYIPQQVHPSIRFNAALAMVEIFHKKILSYPNIKLITSKEDIEKLKPNEKGAILTLEGCDCIGDDLIKLKTLLRLGVTSVGLTWNYANLVADGALENRVAGLTSFGKTVVNELNATHNWCDVSHLSEKSFWDVLEIANFPIASHSNCRKLCENPRNLSDSQITSLLKKSGIIGITFVPEFLTTDETATITDVLRHVEHICSLGGEYQIGFGSDFDGILRTVQHLSSYKEYPNLVNELLKHYSSEQTQCFLYNNFEQKYKSLK